MESKRRFIETGFERRFQRIIREAQRRSSWHIIAAEPGSGKSLGIGDLIRNSGAEKRRDGTTLLPLLAVRAAEEDTKAATLGVALAAQFGRSPPMRWADRKLWLIREMVETRVQCLIIDDAHKLSLHQLAFIKDLTDSLEQVPYERKIGLCLVVASLGGHIPLREIFALQEETWVQFRRRMDAAMPYCRITNHTQEEVKEILVALEGLYRDQFPALNLRRWKTACYTWMTHPVLDPQNSQRVVMDNLVKLVELALHQAGELKESDVTKEMLRQAAEQLTLRRDDVAVIDDLPTKIMPPPITEIVEDHAQERSGDDNGQETDGDKGQAAS